jgi:hypothetical protein
MPQNCLCSPRATDVFDSEQVRTLLVRAQTLSPNPLGVTAEGAAESLTATLHSVAEQVFFDAYGYSFREGETVPSDWTRGTGVAGAADFVTVLAGNMDQVRTCFTNRLRAGGVPESFVGDAVRDIAATAEGVFNNGSLNEWKHAQFKGSYTSPDGSGNPVEARAVFVYTNFAVNEEGTAGTRTAVYYLAVFFGFSK